MGIIVDLTNQMFYVYRNGKQIGRSAINTGIKSHPTAPGSRTTRRQVSSAPRALGARSCPWQYLDGIRLRRIVARGPTDGSILGDAWFPFLKRASDHVRRALGMEAVA